MKCIEFYVQNITVSRCTILILKSVYLCGRIDKHSKKGVYPIMDDIPYEIHPLPDMARWLVPPIPPQWPSVWKPQRFEKLRY